MTKEEILLAVRKLYTPELTTEEEDMRIIDELYEALPHSKITDMIFHDPRNLTPEEVVEEAVRAELSYVSNHTDAN